MPIGGDEMSDIRPEIAEKIQDSLDFLEENLEEDIRLEDLARVACFSIFHYHRLFKEVVGQPAIDYLRKKRLAKAADELIETDEKIASIALRYRFCSQESFTRAFTRQFGLPPGRYRRDKGGMLISSLTASGSGHFHARCMLRAA
jgi:AraC family transcriptional regulator